MNTTKNEQSRFDCVWFWRGGSEVGAWHLADASVGVDTLRQMGFVAHNGKRSIGAPEGPPSGEEIREVLRWKGKTIQG